MDRSIENCQLQVVHILQDSRVYTSIDMYIAKSLPKQQRPRYVTLRVVGISGEVFDAMLQTGLLDDMWLWLDDNKDSYLLAKSRDAVKLVAGDWVLEGIIFFREIRPSLL